uniref:Uncharacterized protein n=1 Tax=Triticum urartu TaxID=4572 RepID=A0A8R7QNC9_TRIUA
MPYPPSPTLGEGCASRDHTPRERTVDELITFGRIVDPVTAGRRVSNRIQGQPDADDMQLARAKRAAMLRHAEATTGHLQSYSLDPYMVLTHSYGLQGAFGYWVQPMGDGRSGYIQPVWMAL